jgi:hypothetical protein
MFRFNPPLTLRLLRGELLTLPPQRGARLRVLSGTVWVTQTNDFADHFLHSGQGMVLQPGALVLVGAELDATFSIHAGNGVGQSILGRLRQALQRRSQMVNIAPATVAG